MNKKNIEKLYKNIDPTFNIELYKGKIYLCNNLHLTIEIDIKHKKLVYEFLYLLFNTFDFSYSLEFYDIDKIKQYISTNNFLTKFAERTKCNL